MGQGNSRHVLERLWFYPPLAFARLGSAPTPVDCYHWGPSDESPRGTGKTTIVPAPTLDLAEDGTITRRHPDVIRFKDPGLGFRPVCPYFELHGAWRDGATRVTGPVTVEVLEALGAGLADVRWTVAVGNLKAFHYTFDAGDRITAQETVGGDHHGPVSLHGTGPPRDRTALARRSAPVPLGHFQVTRPTDDFPGLRLRYTPAKGVVYGPTGFKSGTMGYELPDDVLILNPESSWVGWDPAVHGNDPRTNPGGLYAQDANGVSLGFVDDTCDGLITCEVAGQLAHARFTAGPQDFQPDRRHVVSVADGLKDRVDRLDVLDATYMDADHWGETVAEVRNLLEQIYETMGSMNLDMMNLRSQLANTRMGMPQETAETVLFPPPARPGPVVPMTRFEEDYDLHPTEARQGHDLPLTDFGRQYHRRFVAYEVFAELLRQNPDIFDEWVRNPDDAYLYYTRQMPALMRGSDSLPLTLTRRQYDFLRTWLKRITDES